MSDTIKLRPALIIGFDAEEVYVFLYYFGAFAVVDPILQIELINKGLYIRWSIVGLSLRYARKQRNSCHDK